MGHEQDIPTEVLSIACDNYIRALQLQPPDKLLVVTDKATDDLDAQVRNVFARGIYEREKEKRPSAWLEVPGDVTGTDLEKVTREKIEELNPTEALTVVYMATSWPDRAYFYRTVASWSQRLLQMPRIAGSLGLRIGELEMISQLDRGMDKKLGITLGSIATFFEDNPQGELVIETWDDGGQGHRLVIPFNIAEGKAPYVAGSGRLSKPGQHLQTVAGYGQFTYDNIPGGELYLAGFPYREVRGSVATIHGLVLDVKAGLLANLTGSVKPGFLGLDDLVQNFQQGGRPPFAELGLACIGLIGVKVDPLTCSTLGLEKYLHHIAFGVTVSPTGESAEIEKANEGNPHHTDVMLQKPFLSFRNRSGWVMPIDQLNRHSDK